MTEEERPRSLDDLEFKIAFLERQLEELNTVVVGQQSDIRNMMNYQKLLARKMRDFEIRQEGEFLPTEIPPPHY